MSTRHTDAPRRLRRRWVVLLGAVVLLAAVTGCSDEQRRGLGEEDARDALRAQVTQAVDDAGLAVDGELDCSAAIAEADGALTATCEGAASSGAAVVGTFTGSTDVDAETCLADLVVEIGAAPVAEDEDVDCFDVP